MNSGVIQTKYHDKKISISCYIVSAVFFLVLSQFITVWAPETVTQVFRPILIFAIEVKIIKSREHVWSSVRTLALLSAVHFAIVALYCRDPFMSAGAVILYALMFFSACGTVWNRREIQLIFASVFSACFVCAVILLSSNPIDDFSAPAAFNFLSITVNRNKNAYAFTLGVTIGLIYLLEGRGIPKALIFIMTAVMFYALLYSQCRGAFFCFVGSAFVFLLLYLSRTGRTNPKQFFTRLLIVVIASAVLYLYLKNGPMNRLLDSESTSGRDSGIENAWDMFLSGDTFERFFGHGFVYEMQHTDEAGAHNVYVQFLVSSGIIGASLIALLFLNTLKLCNREVSLPFVVMGVMRTFFEGLDYYIYIPLILAVMVTNYRLYSGNSERLLFVGQSRRSQHQIQKS